MTTGRTGSRWPAGLRPAAFAASPRFAVLLIVSVAFLLRLLHVLSYDPWPTGDMAVFVEMATERLTLANLLDPAGACRYAPGYALFLKPFLLLLAPEAAFTAVRIAQAALGALTCLLVYRLARRLHSRRAGLAAALLACFFQHFLFYSSAYMSENLLIPLLLAALIAFQRAARRGGSGRLYAAGLLAGAAILVRPAALALAPAALLAAWSFRSEGRGEGGRGPWAARLKAIALIAAGGLTLIGPWTLRNWIATGEPVLVAPGASFNLAVGNNPDATGRYMDLEIPGGDTKIGPDRFRAMAAGFVTGDPWGALYVTARLKWRALWAGVPPWPLDSGNPSLMAGEFFFPFLSWRLALFLGLAGLGLLLAQRRRFAWTTLWCLAAYVGYHMVLFGQPRFRMPVEALFLAWGGAAAAALLGRVPPRGFRRARSWAAAISVLLLAVLAQASVSAAMTRDSLARPGSLAAAGGPIGPPASERILPLFSEEPVTLDRSKGRYLRLSFLARRAGPDRATPSAGRIRITFLQEDGETRPWLDAPTFEMDGLPPDRWSPVEIKAHIPPSAAACRVDLLTEQGNSGAPGIDHATLRYAAGNDAALEFLFPYLRSRE